MYVVVPALPSGYVYLTFDSEKSIKSLLMNCTCDIMDASQYYYKVKAWLLSPSKACRATLR